MRYAGGKVRMSRHIAPFVLDKINKTENPIYCEPFVGALGMYQRIAGQIKCPVHLNDVNNYLIEFWKSVNNGWLPPEHITKETYYDAKENPEKYTPEMMGFISVFCSFGGSPWGGYANDLGTRNSIKGARSCAKKMQPILKNVNFSSYDYKLFMKRMTYEYEPKQIVTYCDPPYAGKNRYGFDFSTAEFWEVTKAWSDIGITVLVSEYKAPEFAIKLFEKEATVSISANSNTKKSTEKLFYVPKRM